MAFTATRQRVYDNLGRRVTEVLSNEQRAAGQCTTEFNAARLAPASTPAA